jgi:hypothetical protein
MKTETELPLHTDGLAAAPSVDFINAISEFFETDPSDLLVELGYYKRDEDVSGLADHRSA